MDFRYKIDDRTFDLSVDGEKGSYRVSLGEKVHSVKVGRISENCLFLTIDGRGHRVFLAGESGQKVVWVGGRSYHIQEAEAGLTRRSSPDQGPLDGKQVISSPMPGTIVQLNVSEGDKVQLGQSLVIVEAMKMENDMRSPIDGIIKKINFGAGDLVDAGVPIIELENI